MSSDLTGFSSLARNILFSWGAQFIILIIGFILPRLISDSYGRDMLGIWDLGWATLRYVSVIDLAVGAAMTRYIALYRSQNNPKQLRRIINVGIMWQVIIAAGLFVVGMVFVQLYVYFAELKSSNGKALTSEHIGILHTILLYFVAVLSLQMLKVPSGGILTGYHKFDWQHTLNGVEDIILAVSMVSVVFAGGDLVNLAQIVLAVSVLFVVVRSAVAILMVGRIDFMFSDWNFKLARKMFTFGFKSTLWHLPYVFLVQTIIFMTGSTSTEAVAMFSRAIALVRFGEQAVRRTTAIVMPIVSSLEGLNRVEDNRDLVLKMALYTSLFYFPIVALLVFMGKYLLLMWMGPGYDNGIMMAAFALGSLLPVSQTGSYQVLLGNNQHGRIALKVAAVCLILTAIIYAVFKLKILPINETTAAIMAGIAWTASYSFILPMAIKRFYNISLRTYFWYAFGLPFLACLPFCLGLITGHFVFETQGFKLSAFLYAGLASTIGGVVSLVIYWRYAFDDKVRQAIIQKIPFLNK